MTFKCETCERTSLRGEPAHRIVIETRIHNHPMRSHANRDGSPDPGGTGTQIVKEKIVCGQCIP